MSSAKNSKPYNPPQEERQMSRVMRSTLADSAVDPKGSIRPPMSTGNIEMVNNRLIETKDRLSKLTAWIENDRSALMVDRKPRVDEGGPVRHEMPPFFNDIHNQLDEINRFVGDIEDQIKRMEI